MIWPFLSGLALGSIVCGIGAWQLRGEQEEERLQTALAQLLNDLHPESTTVERTAHRRRLQVMR